MFLHELSISAILINKTSQIYSVGLVLLRFSPGSVISLSILFVESGIIFCGLSSQRGYIAT